ncbi:MAG: DNA polymerase III subunit alpha [Chlamydiota bacterium]
MSWIPLHAHSQYSVLDASAPVKKIAERAAEFGMPAVALTDHGNMHGAVEFYKACRSAGVKPIIGCEVYIAEGSRLERKRVQGKRQAFHLVLLAKNDQGYHNLCKLSSIGYLEGFYYKPRIDKEVLEQHSEGLICLSACLGGAVPYYAMEGMREQALEEARWYKSVFGDDYYFELQRHSMTDKQLREDGFTREAWLQQLYGDTLERQNKVNSFLLEASKELGIKCLATNDSHYIERSDWKAHEILLNVQSGEPCEIWEKDAAGNNTNRILNPKRRVYPSHEMYFKSQQEMEVLFKDIPEALSNTLEVAEKCNFELDFDTKHYPYFCPPGFDAKNATAEERKQTIEDFLWKLCKEAIPKRYTKEHLAKVQEVYPDKEPMEVVEQRLKYEMSILGPKSLCDYILIVYDFIAWAKGQEIPVGPGRGSGAGSIVCYLTGITDIEPLRFNLLFERFINPERMSYPDIDVDICMERRGEVIDYMLRKYGKDNIAQIITFGTMKAKMAVKDVGRVLSVPLSKVNDIAKLIPEDPNMTIEKALEIDPELKATYHQDQEAHRILDIAQTLEGSIRNTGVHAAGVIVSGEPLDNHIPLCRSKDSDIALTQYSMKPVESVGMLKVDFLGLKTLTAIQKAVNSIKDNTTEEIDWVNLPLDDRETFKVFNEGRTAGVFQMESGGMQELARQLHLDRFEEIIAVVSLYRPGPMDMIPSFISRKHGKEAIEYDHPWMKEILAETYGIMVYQEQVMQIASKLANFSLGEGDVLRRAMGKKMMDVMAEQRIKFREGAKAHQIDEEISMQVFDKMEKFASYGFNKSHAAAYGFLAYVTAYLKANFPTEWQAALMSCDRYDIEKVAKFIREAQMMRIDILPPDINEAGREFVPTSQGIRFAMTAIKGVGEGVVQTIVEERNHNGPYKGLYDFIQRIDTKKVGKKSIEALVDAGCFDFTGWSRDAMKTSVEPMYSSAQQEQSEESLGVITLFSLMGEDSSEKFSVPPDVPCPRTKNELLLKEKELLGFFLTGHPMDDYKEHLQRLSCVPFSQISELDVDTVFRSAFIVEEAMVRVSMKTQRKFAILTISDGLLRYELPVWPELYDEKCHLITENRLLYAVLQVQKRDGKRQLNCRWLDDLANVSERMIAHCDKAYDQAKFSVQRQQNAKKDKSEKKDTLKKTPEKKPEKKTKKINLKIDADGARLSHILRLKDGMEKSVGDQPMTLHFKSRGKTFAQIVLNQTYDVKALREQFKPLSSILVIE